MHELLPMLQEHWLFKPLHAEHLSWKHAPSATLPRWTKKRALHLAAMGKRHTSCGMARSLREEAAGGGSCRIQF
eukprot:1139059-Pelagomonas_calceolata.AAC.2